MKYHFTLESRESNEGSWHFRCIPGSNEKSRSDRTSYRISMTSTTANSIDRQLRIFTSLRRPLPFDLLNATQTNICFSSYINFPSIGCSAKSSFVRETRRKSREKGYCPTITTRYHRNFSMAEAQRYTAMYVKFIFNTLFGEEEKKIKGVFPSKTRNLEISLLSRLVNSFLPNIFCKM